MEIQREAETAERIMSFDRIVEALIKEAIDAVSR